MKRTLLVLVAMIMVASFIPKWANAQASTNDEGSDKNFYFTLSPGIAFNAPGKNISVDKPTLGLEVGYQPEKLKHLCLGVKMRALAPYSPATRDSAIVWDSTSSHYKYLYDKTATLLFTVGVLGGKETGFTGGINTGVGAAFVEIDNKLGTCPVWDFTLEGGFNATSGFSVLLSSTYSYLWRQGSLLKQDGFAVILEAKLRFKF